MLRHPEDEKKKFMDQMNLQNQHLCNQASLSLVWTLITLMYVEKINITVKLGGLGVLRRLFMGFFEFFNGFL
jgi:hypothetical protein